VRNTSNEGRFVDQRAPLLSLITPRSAGNEQRLAEVRDRLNDVDVAAEDLELVEPDHQHQHRAHHDQRAERRARTDISRMSSASRRTSIIGSLSRFLARAGSSRPRAKRGEKRTAPRWRCRTPTTSFGASSKLQAGSGEEPEDQRGEKGVSEARAERDGRGLDAALGAQRRPGRPHHHEGEDCEGRCREMQASRSQVR